MEWIKVVEDIIAKFDVIQNEYNKGKMTNGMLESSKNRILELADQIYDMANTCKTDNPVFDQFIKQLITKYCPSQFSPIDAKCNNSSWWSFCKQNVAEGHCQLHNSPIKYVIDLLKALIDPSSFEYLYFNVVSSQYYSLFYVLLGQRIRYLNNTHTKDYKQLQKTVSEFQADVCDYKKINEEVKQTEDKLIDRIEYTRKDMLLMYHEFANMKDRMTKLEGDLEKERDTNQQLREQLSNAYQMNQLAISDLKKELLINNGTLEYIKNIKFSPEYDYDAIKKRNRKLHVELRRLHAIFMRNLHYDVPIAIPVSK